VWALGNRVMQLQTRFEELELEWLDKKDALELLVKRLATRDSRRADRDADNPPPGETTPLSESSLSLPKAALRQVARQRGLIR